MDLDNTDGKYRMQSAVGSDVTTLAWIRTHIRGLTKVINTSDMLCDKFNRIDEITDALTAKLHMADGMMEEMKSFEDGARLINCISQLNFTANRGDRVKLLGYHSSGDGGGGIFEYCPNMDQNLHDGGYFIGSTVPWVTHKEYLNAGCNRSHSTLGGWTRVGVGALTPEMYGQVSGQDAADVLNTVARTARLTGLSVVGFNDYSIGSSVRLSGVNVYLLGNINIATTSTGIILGGEEGDYPTQVLNSLTRMSSCGGANADVLIEDSYNQTIRIEAVPSLVIAATASSVKRCNLKCKDVMCLTLMASADCATTGIVDCLLNLGFVSHFIVTGKGMIANNTVHDAIFPDTGSIEFQSGYNNRLLNTAFNPMQVSVRFGEDSYRNRVESEYISQRSSVIYPALPVEDLGKENTVHTPVHNTYESEVVAAVSISDVRVDTAEGNTKHLSSDLNYLRSKQDGVFDLLKTSPILVDSGDLFVLKVSSCRDHPLHYSFSVSFYNEDMVLITPDADFVESMDMQSVGATRVMSNAPKGRVSFGITSKAIKNGVRYAKCSVLSSHSTGYATSMAITRYSQISGLGDRRSMLTVSGKPTKGYAEQGTRVDHISGQLGYTAVYSRNTLALSATEAHTDKIQVANITNFKVGDSIGIVTNSGETFWTTIEALDATWVKLVDRLSSGVSVGKRVSVVRWV